jgi:hypothetical protein
MADIGFSMGCLYRTNLPIVNRSKLYRSVGASAIELGFARPSEANEFNVTPDLMNEVSKYEYVSIHAPWRDIRYRQDESADALMDSLGKICQKMPVSGIVLHPNVVDDFGYVEDSGLPFLLENMDNKKSGWSAPEDFAKLLDNYKFGFVLDLQHAYKKDPSMKLSEDLLLAFGSRLKHMHVSGFADGETHYPVYASKNKDEICKFLELGVDVPKILEGMLHGNIPHMASNELEFVRRYERNKL